MSKASFTIELDGQLIQSEAAFHQAIADQSSIDWYGRNLDALDEMLAMIIPMTHGPFKIVWRNADLGSWQWQQSYLMIVGTLAEMQMRFPDRFVDFTMTFAEPYFDEGRDSYLRQ